MIFEPWESWCEEFLEDPGSLWQPLCYEAGETHAAVSKLCRNRFWAAGKQSCDLATHWSCSETFSRASAKCHVAVSTCYRINVSGSWQSVLKTWQRAEAAAKHFRGGWVKRATRQFRNVIETDFAQLVARVLRPGNTVELQRNISRWAGETCHVAVSKCYRNNVLGNWQVVLGRLKVWSCSGTFQGWAGKGFWDRGYCYTPAVVLGVAPPRPRLGRGRQIYTYVYVFVNVNIFFDIYI